MDRIAVIGLGAMGSAMAGTLAAKGFRVTGFDRDPAAVARLDGVIAGAGTAALAADAADLLILSLPGPEAVRAALEAAGLTAAGRAPILVVDTSTSAPAVTRRLARLLAGHGHALIDAPVSGGPAGAAAGTLAMAVGGRSDDVMRAMPVLEALATRIVPVGGPGSGHVVKLVNNLLCATHLLAAGEALALTRAAGVDPRKMLEAVNGGSGRSGVTETNLPRWVLSGAFDSGFTMGLMDKDLRLGLGALRMIEVPAPLLETTGRRWAELAALLDGDADFNLAADPGGGGRSAADPGGGGPEETP